MLLAVPDELVVERPELVRSVIACAQMQGLAIVCVVDHHESQARASLAPLAGAVDYVRGDSWLAGAVWLTRATDSRIGRR